MERRVTATEARVRFGEVLKDVTERGRTVVVERAGMPQVVVLSIGEYRRLKAGDNARPAWRVMLDELHEQIRREGNQPLIPPPEDVIRQGREERDEQINDSLH